MHAKFEVCNCNHFKAISINTRKSRCHVTLASPHFRKKILSGHVGTVPVGMPAEFEVRSFSVFWSY